MWVREKCTGPTCGWKLVEKSKFSAKKKKEKVETQTCVWEAQNSLPKCTLHQKFVKYFVTLSLLLLKK